MSTHPTRGHAMNYPEDHPLHGQTAEWIAEQASGRADWAIDTAARSLPRETVALAHEYRRLKAKFDGSSAIDVSLLNERASSRIAWLEAEVAKLRERAESAEMALETKSDELGAMLSNAKQEIRTLKHELETSNGYRTGISNDLDQTQLQSNEFSRELNDVARMFEERPARGVLFGPGIEDGVAFIVSKRLVRDAERIKELEVERNSAQHQLKWLEAEHNRVIQKELDANKVKWQAWVDGGDAPADATTTPPLDRIAAALERIANAN